MWSAIGNPYNLGQTITQGIISATGRIGLNPTGRQNFLQTDASINHGNSGGALVNSLGELMGINTLSFDKSNDGETPEGIGFAIPFQLATKIMDKLIRDGRVIRGYIGISGRELRRCMLRAAASISCRGLWLMTSPRMVRRLRPVSAPTT
jgi:serine protease DegS